MVYNATLMKPIECIIAYWEDFAAASKDNLYKTSAYQQEFWTLAKKQQQLIETNTGFATFWCDGLDKRRFDGTNYTFKTFWREIVEFCFSNPNLVSIYQTLTRNRYVVGPCSRVNRLYWHVFWDGEIIMVRIIVPAFSNGKLDRPETNERYFLLIHSSVISKKWLKTSFHENLFYEIIQV